MEKTIQHLETELTHVRAGKISPAILDGIMVDYYGSHIPINQPPMCPPLMRARSSFSRGKKACSA